VPNESIAEENKGLYYNVNKRKKAGTSRDADSPKAPTAQAWKDAAKTAKKESVAEGEVTKTATGLICSTAMSPIGLPTPQATMEAIMANSGLLFRIVPQVSRITRELVNRSITCRIALRTT
jgi:hypothetical protein